MTVAIVKSLLRAGTLWLVGFVLLLHGRLLARSPERGRGFGDSTAVRLVRFFKGQEAATELEEKLRNPERLRCIGRQQVQAAYVLFAFGVIDLAMHVLALAIVCPEMFN